MQLSPKQILKKFWGFENFRGSQEEIINTIICGNDVLALMPTGGGKSLCFQIPALCMDGICIVVSPLVALIQNQVKVLHEKGIKASALVGGISSSDLDILLDNCIYGNYKFLYLSPERLQQQLVRERIKNMNVNLFAIDEAHCISEWGHDFRPSYLKCHVLKELHPNVPTVALTATATEMVSKDIIDNLNISDAIRFKDAFERENIAFQVKFTENKQGHLTKLMATNKVSSIIYVRTRKDTHILSGALNEKGGNANSFHGGLSSLEKNERLNHWLNDQVKTMVATNAFGMGVDKSNVRMVVHYQIPESIENYFQEAGRAGRDGNKASAILLTNQADIERAGKQYLGSLPNVKYVKKVYKKLNSFFQIAYSEGQNQTFGLNFSEFCNRYELKPNKAYTALRILNQNGVLSLSETSGQKTTIKLTVKKETLFQWLEHHPSLAKAVQALLRTYGGVFDFQTKINLDLISKKIHVNQKEVINSFKKLHQDKLAEFTYAQSDLELTFLLPREDEKTINSIASNIKLLNKTKTEKFRQMLAYVNNTTNCRVAFLLNYFGEKTVKKCGKCDVCRSKKDQSVNLKYIKIEILEQLKHGFKTSGELVTAMVLDEGLIIRSIKELLEDGKVVLKANNKYGIGKGK